MGSISLLATTLNAMASFYPISQNSAMFALLGTTYGGDGVTTFGLPDLRGRVPLHIGTGYAQGQIGGAETVTLTANQMPSHTHTLTCNVATGTSQTPAGNFLATAYRSYGPGTTQVSMHASSVSSVGSGTAHNNLMPYLTINYVIALEGIFLPALSSPTTTRSNHETQTDVDSRVCRSGGSQRIRLWFGRRWPGELGL